MSACSNVDPINRAPKSASLAGSEPQLLYRVRDAAKVLGLSERKVWDLLTRRELTAVKVDGATRIKRSELLRFIEEL
jgi:excisionase family DNA binding protein